LRAVYPDLLRVVLRVVFLVVLRGDFRVVLRAVFLVLRFTALLAIGSSSNGSTVLCAAVPQAHTL